MGRPSLIVVDEITFEESKNSTPLEDPVESTSLVEKRVSYQLLGQVEIDNKETIQLSA
jgi:hypothetical protein